MSAEIPNEEVPTAAVPIDENVDRENLYGENELPDVLLTQIRDGIVSERTRSCYLKENFQFMVWLQNESPTSLTEYGLRRMNAMFDETPVGLSARQFFSRNRSAFDDLTRGCGYQAIIAVEELTPEIYMDYCRSLRNLWTRNYLGKSTIGVKRAALYHLYRLHNGSGYSSEFNLTLNNLFRGFYRVLTSRRGIITENIIGKDDVATTTTRNVVLPKWNQVICICIFLIFFYIFN
jgi:hypothetical protein